MAKEKVTLREILKSVKEAAHKDEMLINHRNFLYEVEENLEQLERRITEIKREAVTKKHPHVEFACEKILGKK